MLMLMAVVSVLVMVVMSVVIMLLVIAFNSKQARNVPFCVKAVCDKYW